MDGVGLVLHLLDAGDEMIPCLVIQFKGLVIWMQFGG
jgi:hypothetical protein